MGPPSPRSADRILPGLPWILGGLATIGPFCIDTVFPAFSRLEKAFATEAYVVQQSVSVYLVAYALMSVVHGPLSDALGRRKVVLGGLFAFGLASVGCALSSSITMLLVFRALQGLFAGVGMIVGRAVIRDLYTGEPAQRLMSLASMVFSIAPAIAPILGGWLLAFSSWPIIFWFLVALSALLWLVTWLWLPETHPPQERQPVALAPLLGGYWSIAQDLRFVQLSITSALNFGALFLYIASAPEIILKIFALGERDFGWLFLPIIAGMSTGSFLSGRMAGRWSAHTQLRIAFCFCLGSTAANVLYNGLYDAPQLPGAIVPLIFHAFGVALAFPILMLAILDRHPQRRGGSSSMQTLIGQLSNAMVAGLVAPALHSSLRSLSLASFGFALCAWLVWKSGAWFETTPDQSPA